MITTYRMAGFQTVIGLFPFEVFICLYFSAAANGCILVCTLLATLKPDDMPNYPSGMLNTYQYATFYEIFRTAQGILDGCRANADGVIGWQAAVSESLGVFLMPVWSVFQDEIFGMVDNTNTTFLQYNGSSLEEDR